MKKEASTQKQKKSIIAYTQLTQTKGNKMEKQAPNQKHKKKTNID